MLTNALHARAENFAMGEARARAGRHELDTHHVLTIQNGVRTYSDDIYTQCVTATNDWGIMQCSAANDRATVAVLEVVRGRVRQH